MDEFVRVQRAWEARHPPTFHSLHFTNSLFFHNFPQKGKKTPELGGAHLQVALQCFSLQVHLLVVAPTYTRPCVHDEYRSSTVPLGAAGSGGAARLRFRSRVA